MHAIQRSPVFTVPVVLGLFFGGGYGGIELARTLAPDSVLAPFIGLFTLPGAFFIGIVAWAGATFIGALRLRLKGGREKRPSLKQPEASKPAVPPPAPWPLCRPR